MKARWWFRDERGIALVVVLLVALVIAVISAGAALVSSNNKLISSYSDKQSLLETVAEAGLEEARSSINGNSALYPDSEFNTLESGVQVKDASGSTIPGVTRSLYVGPTGITSGQYGVFGSVVSVVQDAAGNKVIRRGEVVQESFAKYAYFTNVEPATIAFGGGDQIFGPVHSNDVLKIYSSGATFHGPVETHQTISGKAYGTFAQGYTEHGPFIAMPQTAQLTKLKNQATAGSTAFVSTTNGSIGQATLRIEFWPVDINGDGFFNGANEGFIRVYSSNDFRWLSGSEPADYGLNYLRNSDNCGHYEPAVAPNPPQFVSARNHPLPAAVDNWQVAIESATRRCLLGGSDSLNAGGAFVANDGKGQWLAWPGAVDPQVTAAAQPAGIAPYLFPINRTFNPNFKGVIYVEGKVVVSGRLRGQVTLAATDNIIIGDDINYVTNPATGTCQDIAGFFGGGDIVVSDNTLNSAYVPRLGRPYTSFDDTRDETIHGVLLALANFEVENYNAGATGAQPCGATPWGRGCLSLTGGVIQSQRGAVGTGTGTGYLKRYSYDQCAYSNPPPYFPTTGHFAKGHYYEVDPVNFNVASYYQLLAPPI